MATKAKTKSKPAPAAAETPVEKTESPRERFLRLAPPRTESAIKRIKLLSNLAGSGYEYERAEATQIVEALFDAVHDLKRRFEKKAKGKSTFAFRSKRQAAE